MMSARLTWPVSLLGYAPGARVPVGYSMIVIFDPLRNFAGS